MAEEVGGNKFLPASRQGFLCPSERVTNVEHYTTREAGEGTQRSDWEKSDLHSARLLVRVEENQ